MADIKSMTCLGGNYRGKNADLKSILHHAVSDEPITIGRMKREPGEAFCSKVLYNEDSYSWENGTKIDCPKCVEIVNRLAAGKKVS